MSTAQARSRFGPDSLTVSDSITAGLDGQRLVEFDAGQAGRIKYAVADSAAWVGVLAYPIVPAAALAAAAATTNAFGDNAFSYVPYPSDGAVIWTGEVILKFTNTTGSIITLNPGDAVYADANGFVKKIAVPVATARKVGMYVGTTVVTLAATTGTGTGLVRLANA
jgi:hypothetical protein